MKKISILFIIVTLYLLLPTPAVSDTYYLIILKNGGSLTTPMYWLKNSQMYFVYADGIVGIQRDLVQDIKKQSDGEISYRERETREEKISEKEPVANAIEKASPEKAVVEDPKNKELRDELNKIEGESAEAWEVFRNLSQQDTASQTDREEARKRVFKVDVKKKELREKLGITK